jgi:hypothetical protein
MKSHKEPTMNPENTGGLARMRQVQRVKVPFSIAKFAFTLGAFAF